MVRTLVPPIIKLSGGMILAALVFIRKVPSTTTVSQVTEEYVREGYAHILQHKEIRAYVTIFRIHGPFLFGATDKVEEIFAQIEELPPIVILRLRNMTAIDATGLQALEKLGRRRTAPAEASFCAARGNNRRG